MGSIEIAKPIGPKIGSCSHALTMDVDFVPHTFFETNEALPHEYYDI